jgi:hypothetical protein
MTDRLTILDGLPAASRSAEGADARADAERGWWAAAWRELGALAATGFTFTADDVRRRVGGPDHPARWGGVFLAASRAGLIQAVGVRRPATASRHSGLTRVWKRCTGER